MIHCAQLMGRRDENRRIMTNTSLIFFAVTYIRMKFAAKSISLPERNRIQSLTYSFIPSATAVF